MAEEEGNKGCMGMRWRCPWPGVWIQANQAIQTLDKRKRPCGSSFTDWAPSAFFWEVLTLKIGTGTPPLPVNHARVCVCFILKSLYPPVTTSCCLILFHSPCCTWDFGRLFIGLSIISTQSASAVFCGSTVMDARRLNNEWVGKNVCVCMSDSDRSLLNLHFLSSQWTQRTVFAFLKH